MNAFQKELEEVSSLCQTVNIDNPELKKEITALGQSADEIVLLLYSRRCLEVMVTEICESILNRERGSEPMKGILDRLYKEKMIPAYIHTAMSNVNSNSTYGAHPKEFDKRMVRSTLLDLTTVFEWYFFELKKLEKISAEPAKEKSEIKKPAEGKQAEKAREKTTSSASEKSKKPVTVPVIITAVAVVAVTIIILLVSNKKSGPEKETAVTTTTDTVKNVTQPMVSNTILPDAGKVNEDVTKTDTEVTRNEEKPAPAVKTLDLPEDIQECLKILSDKSKSPAMRQATIAPFLKRFTTDAQVEILKNGYWVDGKSIKDYMNWVLVSGNLYQIQVVSAEKSSEKIKLMKVEHNR